MIELLPTINAFLNGTSAVLLITGFVLIKKGSKNLHKVMMLSAIGTSALFLIFYLTHHFYRESLIKQFLGTGLIKTVYYIILASHSILALVILPLILIAVARALKDNFDNHKKIARWAFPLWLYVSVTGVLVYLMLYQLY